jgi:hypothetical protein
LLLSAPVDAVKILSMNGKENLREVSKHTTLNCGLVRVCLECGESFLESYSNAITPSAYCSQQHENQHDQRLLSHGRGRQRPTLWEMAVASGAPEFWD